MTKRITLKAAKAMTEQWFSMEWLSTFNSYMGGEPDPKRLEDLLFATKLIWKYQDPGVKLDFPSGNRGSIYQAFEIYRSGGDFLNDLMTTCEHPEVADCYL